MKTLILVDMGLLRATFLGVTAVVTFESSSLETEKKLLRVYDPSSFSLHTVV